VHNFLKDCGAVIVPNLTQQQFGLSAFTPPLSPRTNLQRGNRCNPAALRLLNIHHLTLSQIVGSPLLENDRVAVA